ncbi:MAG: hypothetical protein HQL20_09875 [Candidatus Omnitrophica bacterium]|nr:hypothetical protein [Candidatus Omnitrophota bacterium]
MESRILECGLSLEEAFFRKRDAELIEQHRRLENIKKTREALGEISGIRNPKVLDKLIELEVSPQILSSIAVVPLIEVAWADGAIDVAERAAVLAGAAGNGIAPGSADYALLENWLQHRPPAKLLDAWMHYISGLCEIMSKEECQAFRKELIDRARRVASASGGVMGLVRISLAEQDVLHKMESAFVKNV